MRQLRKTPVALLRRLPGAEDGTGFLEAAAFLGVLLAFVIGAAAVVDYIQERRFAAQAVDKHVYDSALRPLRIDGRSRIGVNRVALGRYLDQVARGIEDELRAHGAAEYFVEALYAEVPIDVQSGRACGAHAIGERAERGRRGFVPAELLAATALEARIVELLRQAAGGDLPLGAPSALNGGEHGAGSLLGVQPDAFLPFAVLIGARAY